MREIDLLKSDPKKLFDMYMQIIIEGGGLDDSQLIMLEAVRKILGLNENGI